MMELPEANPDSVEDKSPYKRQFTDDEAAILATIGSLNLKTVLTDREVDVIKEYVTNGLNEIQTAEKLHISVQRVSQLYNSAAKKLCQKIGE